MTEKVPFTPGENNCHGLFKYKDTKSKCRQLKKIDLERDSAAGVY